MDNNVNAVYFIGNIHSHTSEKLTAKEKKNSLKFQFDLLNTLK